MIPRGYRNNNPLKSRPQAAFLCLNSNTGSITKIQSCAPVDWFENL